MLKCFFEIYGFIMCQQPSMWITTDDNVTYKLVFAKEIQEMLKHFHSFTHSCFLTIESKKKNAIFDMLNT